MTGAAVVTWALALAGQALQRGCCFGSWHPWLASALGIGCTGKMSLLQLLDELEKFASTAVSVDITQFSLFHAKTPPPGFLKLGQT